MQVRHDCRCVALHLVWMVHTGAPENKMNLILKKCHNNRMGNGLTWFLEEAEYKRAKLRGDL